MHPVYLYENIIPQTINVVAENRVKLKSLIIVVVPMRIAELET